VIVCAALEVAGWYAGARSDARGGWVSRVRERVRPAT